MRRPPFAGFCALLCLFAALKGGSHVRNPAHGSGRIVQGPTSPPGGPRVSIPPTAVGGLFKSLLAPWRSPSFNPAHGSGRIVQAPSSPLEVPEFQSRPRQWADCSSPLYKTFSKEQVNPAHGSGRILQALTIYSKVRS